MDPLGVLAYGAEQALPLTGTETEWWEQAGDTRRGESYKAEKFCV